MTYSIPKVLFQTHKVPLEPYVTELVKAQLDDDWSYQFYDDTAILNFFDEYPLDEFPHIKEKFYSFTKGAHRADLFRYYYLYIKGGFFLDSDAIPCKPLSALIQDIEFLSAKSFLPDTLFQGILATHPKNTIVYKALKDIYRCPDYILKQDYHRFCRVIFTFYTEEKEKYATSILKEYHYPSGDLIVNTKEEIVFKHFWKTKIIPRESEHTKIFKSIYQTNFWIQGSGPGSSIENTVEYREKLISFLKENSIRSVTDLGCGDWQSSHLIYSQIPEIDYLGIDCVDTVVTQNSLSYPKYKFECMDFCENSSTIRDSDVYILKDVLQHWKLESIHKCLSALQKKKYRFILIINYGNQQKEELDHFLGIGRGLHSSHEPLRSYGAIPWFDYWGGEPKHACYIQNIPLTEWNSYTESEAKFFCTEKLFPLVESPFPLQRLGPCTDGGYVVAECGPYDFFVSCGIADDLRFEDAFLDKYTVQCLAFDGTIQQKPPSRHSELQWIKKNIGSKDTETTTTLLQETNDAKEIFLKMDIEGSEFNWIDRMSVESLLRFRQIVMEIHWPFDLYRQSMVEKLAKTHVVIHIHGNNYGTILKDSTFPEVVEVTYLRKDLAPAWTRIGKQFPTALDAPNNPRAPDLKFEL